MTSLTKQILECQNNDGDWAEATSTVSELVYTYARSGRGVGSQDSAEFLLYFYPRMRRLMERYCSNGSSFEAYLNTTLRWQLRSFAVRKGTDKIRLRTAEITGATEVGHAGTVRQYREAFSRADRRPPEAPESRTCKDARKRQTRITTLSLRPRLDVGDGGLTNAEAQRVLMLALKGSDHLEREECLRLAGELGVRQEWLLSVWSELRLCCTVQRARRERVRERRDRAWFTLRCLESETMTYASAAVREAHQNRTAYWKRTYANACERLRHIAVAPTHRQIAEALGIPKGTVDSSLFKARKELEDDEFRDRLARVFNST